MTTHYRVLNEYGDEVGSGATADLARAVALVHGLDDYVILDPDGSVLEVQIATPIIEDTPS